MQWTRTFKENKEIDVEVAEREGFEPPIQLPVCRISSAVLSTTQPPLRAGGAIAPPRVTLAIALRDLCRQLSPQAFLLLLLSRYSHCASS
jgi:hypothetical protein